ncbi:hypothetical protein Poli38472_011569 [Pythium oligandrum]|uniref:Cyclin-dependent kinase 2 homolog n=1 Tax=Pythium oligandrum TaxID=41045 RepID=A0A8K1CJF4_PYTOL|nr:hypothetical protein Poli38472_011569 [Pythium oligandrum]|eukprot:TMW64689.1 hypothetical protein Poli38472_011569 [Pythium oligandrum]
MRRKLIGDDYEKRAEIGRGTYGTVYDGVHVESQRRVAIKKVIGKEEAGEAEAELLRQCQDCQHVVQMLDVVRHNGKVYLVLEFMDTDLETIIKATEEIPELDIAHVKAYLRMLLEGVKELHDRNILHRDLKPNNLLISKRDRVAKITDFGMATRVDAKDTERKLSIQVITRAYRPPELFFGEDRYDASVDMWSVGCIFAEMLLRRPYFDGASDIDQLSLIFNALGSPDENGWERAAQLPFHLKFRPTNPKPLSEQFPQLSDAGLDLLSRFLQVDPTKRISVTDALQHAFFTEEPTASEIPGIEEPPEASKKRTLADLLNADEAEDQQEDGGDDEEEANLPMKGRRII